MTDLKVVTNLMASALRMGWSLRAGDASSGRTWEEGGGGLVIEGWRCQLGGGGEEGTRVGVRQFR